LGEEDGRALEPRRLGIGRRVERMIRGLVGSKFFDQDFLWVPLLLTLSVLLYRLYTYIITFQNAVFTGFGASFLVCICILHPAIHFIMYLGISSQTQYCTVTFQAKNEKEELVCKVEFFAFGGYRENVRGC
jgi:uncharacterized membrane protein